MIINEPFLNHVNVGRFSNIFHLNQINIIQTQSLQTRLNTGQGLLSGEVKHVSNLLLVPPNLGRHVETLPRNRPSNKFSSICVKKRKENVLCLLESLSQDSFRSSLTIPWSRVNVVDSSLHQVLHQLHYNHHHHQHHYHHHHQPHLTHHHLCL